MSPLVSEGLSLALYGMGTVFVFLTVLVFATMLMSWLVLKTVPASEPERSDTSNSKKMAAITAAIHAHRSKQG
ncbi:MAG: OadG family protein [Pseudomonadales bacterium]|nr:OadG family protein [Pseudomonadales bacterium]MBO6596172.1 OadG family protein [Pseudomonadales bacterium]MBO6822652.1 OadG family protein [Pseudomonadales bacterium]